MAISKYTLYKYVKVEGTWRYCKAPYHDNGKIKPDIVFVNVKKELLEKHTEGRYYMSHNGKWHRLPHGDSPRKPPGTSLQDLVEKRPRPCFYLASKRSAGRRSLLPVGRFC